MPIAKTLAALAFGVLAAVPWRTDVDYLARELPKRHLNAFHAMSREEFARAIAELRTKSTTANDDQMLVGFMQITARVGDGHTRVHLPANAHRLPVSIGQFENEFRVIAANDEAKPLLGGKLVKIDDVDIADVVQRVRSVISQDESEPFVRGALPGTMLVTEVLHGLDIVKDPLHVRLTIDGGQTLEVNAVAANAKANEWPNAAKATPLFRQSPADALFFTWLEPQKTVYVNFRRYDDLGGRSRELWKFVDAHPTAKIVIDLRQNGGGDYTKGRRFLVNDLKARPKIKPYVLIGPRTFSAAMNNAIDFRNDAKATLVGLPIGEKPNSYQENDEMTLPESKLVVSYSTKFYNFLPDGAPPIVSPDVTIEPRWEDYVAGRDAALEWALAH
jgi:hypothetical protein